jgi:hypothetical protein
MELDNEFITRHIEKIRTDGSLSEETKARRIEMYEAMRPEDDGGQDQTRKDIEKWAKGTRTTSGKISVGGGKLQTTDPKADIEKWAKSKQ